MIGVPSRAQAALPRGRWAPNIGFYPPPRPASPIAELLTPPHAPAMPAAPLPMPPPPPPPPVTMASPAQGMQVGGGEDGLSSGPQPSVPSPNQNLASVVDAALTGVGMLIGGPMAMLGAIPAMAALSTLPNPQPTLGVLGAISQLMGHPTVGQMVEGMLGGGSSSGGGGGGGRSGPSPDQVANAFAMNDPWGTYDFATDTWGGGGFSGIGSEAGSLAGSSTDSMGNPVI